MAVIKLQEVYEDYYMIPNYQRGFSWQDKQLDDFWNDINTINNNNHFFGSFYVEEKDFKHQTYQLLIDGQQRLTTLTIFLFELINSIENYDGDLVDIHMHLVYQRDNPNKEFLEKIIFDDVYNSEPEFENSYQKNLFNAKKYFISKLTDNKINKEKLLASVMEGLLFDVVNINNDLGKDINSQIIFETLNNRGKPLSVLEKLKNRLMYLNSKLPGGTQTQENRINTIWENIYNLLGTVDDKYINENIPLDDDLVSAHLTIYRRSENTTFSTKGASEKLFQMFSLTPEVYPLREISNLEEWNNLSEEEKTKRGRESKLTRTKIKEYIESLEAFTESWVNILNFNSIKNEKLRKCLMLDSTKELKILLATIGMNETTQYKNKIYPLLEAILFRQTLPNEWPRTRNFATLAYYFYNQHERLDDEINITRDNLYSELREALAEEFDSESVSEGFKSYYTSGRGAAGFYKWKGLKYFLYEYDKQITLPSKDQGDSLDYDQIEIEHILPRDWSNWSDVISPNNRITQNVYINTLGNLTILDKEKNRHIKNSDWQTKKESYLNSEDYPVTKSEKEICNISRSHGGWNLHAIGSRGRRMFDFLISKINSFSYGNGNNCSLNKDAILFYDGTRARPFN